MVVPFPRQFGPGATGADVKAVKRALVKWAKVHAPGQAAGVVINQSFSAQAQELLGVYKGFNGLLRDPIYTVQAHDHLRAGGWFDAYGASLMVAAWVRWHSSRQRQAFLSIASACIVHRNLFDYSERLGDAPGERGNFRVSPLDWARRYSCDCSQFFVGCGKHGGLTDPIFSSEAATGSLLGLKRVSASQAEPGDAVIWVGPSWPAGHHITILYEKLADGDWKVANMGGEGDPNWSTLSAQQSYQAGVGAPTRVYIQLPT